MAVILPLIALVLLLLIFYKKTNYFRHSLLSSSICWGLLLTIITEVLSLIQSLVFSYLSLGWGFINILLIFIYLNIKLTKHKKKIDLKKIFYKLSNFWIIIVLGVTFVVTIVGLTALISPPNNRDSMDYHMARVAYWIQNHSLNHYPTHYLAQLYQGPLAELIIVNLQILSGGDYLANLVQWLSLIGSLLGVSLIAKLLGADLWGQLFSAVVAATIPMGILQGSSTQNDYVASFWLVCLTYFVLLNVKGQRNWSNFLQLSFSLGLAILTKGTSYIYALPLIIWFLLSELKYLKWQIWKPTLMLGIVVFIINLGHYSRNYLLFGKIIFTGNKYTNDAFSLPIFISNFIRNIALHLRTPVQSFNFLLQKVVSLIHQILGIDISDIRTTWSGQEFQLYFPSGQEAVSSLLHENLAANTLHLLLIVGAIFILFFQGKYKKDKLLFYYCIILISMFFLFCLLLKWQPWNSRLHLPIFVLFSPFSGSVFSRFKSRSFITFLSIFLIISSFPWVFFNTSRPIISNLKTESILTTSRTNQYFNNWPTIKNPYLKATGYINSQECSKIGLTRDFQVWQYPLFIFIKPTTSNPLEIRNINVTNISSEKMKVEPYKHFIPCAIISLNFPDQKKKISKEINTNTGTYSIKFSSRLINVFMKQ
ncbi:conserved hypothetical protein [Rippkaea orientalis PCC 8801]|uniref:Glycosyltransferase RgtA/B/C/D-like domain-containing protein n=1 Tax=Rippkaea orientalis (strain PCC 8801 / RF-1) TaxID=41431 RepID=B7K678_RIPO1|nr:glycosyltransferase family 39 protein [Rippkaea orientalis]ACK68131.1 conserved hypothetical protein [Rippkaea orientalis PCC 8801]